MREVSGSATTIHGVPRLTREQQRVLDVVLSEQRFIRDPRARRVFRRAAVQTGLVESGLRNLRGGDADSQGWRQERASLYPNPRNLRASARRFRQEFQDFYDPGEKAWQVAAQVQRPAAQYADRYRRVAPQAKAILRQLGQDGRNPLIDAAAGEMPSGSAGLAPLLAQLLEKPVASSSAGVASPAHSARAVMPSGYREPVAGAVAPKQDTNALLEAVRTAGGGIPGLGARRPPRAAGGRSGGRSAPGTLLEMFYDPGINLDSGRRVSAIGGHGSHVHAAFDSPRAVRQAAALAQRMGLEVRENPAYDPVDPVHTPGSLHYQTFKGGRLGKAIDVSGDSRKLRAYNRRVARRFR